MISPSRAAVLLALALGAASARADEIQVRLTETTRKDYTVEGVFQVKASSTAVWSVLTDYDHIARFVPAMRESRLVETKADGGLVVDQEAVGSVLFFSKAVHVRLDVHRADETLRFVDVIRKDFRLYSGSWNVRAAGDSTEVTYRLEAEPDFLSPAILMRRGLKRGAADLLDQVRAEIVRRAAK